MFGTMGAGGGNGRTTAARAVKVSSTATGTLWQIPHLLGTTSTLSLVSAATNANLGKTGDNITATAAIGNGVTQKAVIRESLGDEAIEYAVNFTGAAILGALALSAASVTLGSSVTINLTGATAGSTITGAVPDGLTLNSAARTITGTPTLAGAYTFNLSETLGGATNSPKVTNVALAVAAPVAPVLTLVGGVYTSTLEGQFLVDGVAVGPANAFTLVEVPASHVGRHVRVVSGGIYSNTLFTAAALAAPTVHTFSGVTADLATDGWTSIGGTQPGDAAKFTVVGGQLQVVPGAASGPDNVPPVLVRNAGTTNFSLNQPFLTSKGHNRTLFAGVDQKNYLIWRRNSIGSNQIQMTKTINGVSSAVSPEMANGWIIPNIDTDGAEVIVDTTLGIIRLFARSNVGADTVFKQYNVRPLVNPPAFSVEGTDVYPVPTELLGGTLYGASPASNTVYHDNITMQPTSRPILLRIVSQTVSPADSAKIRVTLTGTYGGIVDDIQFLTLLSDGTLLQDWTAGTALSGNVINQWIDLPLSGDNYTLIARDPTSPQTTAVAITAKAPVYEPVLPLVMGVNSSTAVSYSYSDIVKDRFFVGDLNWRNSVTNAEIPIPASDLNADGYPIGPVPAGYDSIFIVPFENSRPGIRPGPWQVSANAASTISTNGLNNLTASSITSTGCVLTVVNQALGTTGGVLFKNPTFPAEGFRPSVLPVGEASPATDLVTPELGAIWNKTLFGGGRFWHRNMKDTGAEAAQEFPIRPRMAGTAKFAVSMNKQFGTDIHHNVPWSDIALRPETTVRPFLQFYKDNALSGAPIAVAVANEVWNFNDPKQFMSLAHWSISNGLMPEISIPGGTTITNETYDAGDRAGGRVSQAGGFGTTIGTIYPGEWFVCRAANSQFALIECVSATPVAAGAIVPGTIATSNSTFACRGAFNEMVTATRRAQCELQKRLAIMGREILGNRFISVLECNMRDDPAQLAGYLLYNNTYQYVDCYSPAFYSGVARTFASQAWAAQHTSNPTAFSAGYYALRRSETDASIALLVNMKHAVRTLLRAAGVPNSACPEMDHFYEGGDHGTITGVPSGEQAAFIGAVANCLKSSAEGTEIAYQMNELKTKVGGTFMWFDDVEYPYQNGTLWAQWFGMRQRQFNSSLNSNGADEQRYNAVKAATATATVPAQVGALTLTPATGGTITVGHAAPADGGSAITDYRYEYRRAGTTTWLLWSDAVSATPGAVITGLIDGVFYNIRAAAINTIGTGDASAAYTDAPIPVLPRLDRLVAYWNTDGFSALADNTAVGTWTDTVGSLSWVQAMGTKQPKARTGGVNGKIALQFDGVDDFMALTTPGAVKTALDSFEKSILVVFDGVQSASNGVLMGATAGGAGWGLHADGAVLRGPAAGHNPLPSQPFTGTGYMTFGFTATSTSSLGGSGSHVYRHFGRGKPIAVSATQAPVTSGRTISLGAGALDTTPTWFFKGRVYAIPVWDVCLTPDQYLQAENYFNWKYAQADPAFTFGSFLAVDGDSLMGGVNSITTAKSSEAPPALIAAALGRPIGAWGNYGLGGISIANSAAKAVNEIDTLYARLGVPNRYAFEEFFNSAQSRTSAQMASDLTAHFAARRAALGANVKIMACTPSDYSDAISRVTTNGVWGPLLRANYAAYGADYLADIALDPDVGAVNAYETFGATYWNGDAIHHNAAGYAKRAAVITAAITAAGAGFG